LLFYFVLEKQIVGKGKTEVARANYIKWQSFVSGSFYVVATHCSTLQHTRKNGSCPHKLYQVAQSFVSVSFYFIFD